MSLILHSAYDLKKHADMFGEKLIVTSGGFDPMHVGHLRCLLESAEMAHKMSVKTKLAVIVNGDGFLYRKKGYAFMPEAERMEIIAGVRGVDYVIPWDDGGQTVTDALEILQPIIFTKGGDRDAAANVPEFELCKEMGCTVMFNVGGGKIQSSSTLVDAIKSKSQ